MESTAAVAPAIFDWSRPDNIAIAAVKITIEPATVIIITPALAAYCPALALALIRPPIGIISAIRSVMHLAIVLKSYFCNFSNAASKTCRLTVNPSSNTAALEAFGPALADALNNSIIVPNTATNCFHPFFMELKSILEILDITLANPYIATTELNNVSAPLAPPKPFAFPTAIIRTDNDPTANTKAPIVLPASSIL